MAEQPVSGLRLGCVRQPYFDDLDPGGPQRGDGPFERGDGLGPGGGPLVAAVPGDAQPS